MVYYKKKKKQYLSLDFKKFTYYFSRKYTSFFFIYSHLFFFISQFMSQFITRKLPPFLKTFYTLNFIRITPQILKNLIPTLSTSVLYPRIFFQLTRVHPFELFLLSRSLYTTFAFFKFFKYTPVALNFNNNRLGFLKVFKNSFQWQRRLRRVYISNKKRKKFIWFL